MVKQALFLCKRRELGGLKRDARAASQKWRRVSELVPEIVLGNGRVVRALSQLGAGNRLDQQQV